MHSYYRELPSGAGFFFLRGGAEIAEDQTGKGWVQENILALPCRLFELRSGKA